MQVYILAFVIALFTSWLLTPYVKKLAFRIGALDKPDGRKVHKASCRDWVVWPFILGL